MVMMKPESDKYEGGNENDNSKDNQVKPDDEAEPPNNKKLMASIKANKMWGSVREGKGALAELLNLESKEQITTARKVLRERRDEYLKHMWKKWVILAVGLAIGTIIGIAVPAIYNKLGNSLYDRTAIEALF